jgi:TM2 domain-containing membrane protein YozV
MPMIEKKIKKTINFNVLKPLILLIMLALSPLCATSNPHQSLKYLNENNSDLLDFYAFSNDTSAQIHLKYAHKRSVAVVLAILLGPFGVHRLYLGTHAKVPVIYTLTLGGGFGILPLIDIVAILSNRKWEEEFISNEKVIMWAK